MSTPDAIGVPVDSALDQPVSMLKCESRNGALCAFSARSCAKRPVPFLRGGHKRLWLKAKKSLLPKRVQGIDVNTSEPGPHRMAI